MLHHTFLGNSVENYLWFAGILLAGLVFKRLLSRLLSAGLFRFFRKNSFEVGAEAFIGLLSSPFQFLIMVVILYFACDRLSFPAEWHLVSDEVFGVRFVLDHMYAGLMVVSITWLILRLVDYFGLVLLARAHRSTSKSDDQLIPFLKEGVKVIIAGVGFLIMLGVAFELDIVSLVTGLGIGGLAIALAAKETLENLLGSFTIFLDKPFSVGDQVRVGSIEGHVESIGFRSARIRALDKMLVILPNKKMVDAELINETERELRRFKLVLHLRRDTSPERLREMVESLHDYLKSRTDGDGKPLVNFKEITASSFDVHIVAVLRIPDGDEFTAVQEEINYIVLEKMKQFGCDFAPGANTLVVEKL
jgi:MscS family membrane protein